MTGLKEGSKADLGSLLTPSSQMGIELFLIICIVFGFVLMRSLLYIQLESRLRKCSRNMHCTRGLLCTVSGSGFSPES